MKDPLLWSMFWLAIIGAVLVFIISYGPSPYYEPDCLNKIALEHCLKNNCEVIKLHKGKVGKIYLPNARVFDFNDRAEEIIRYSETELEKCEVK